MDVLVRTIIVQARAKLNSSKLSRAQPIISEANRPAKHGPCHNIGSDISGTQYDVAHVKWGGNWHMPTYEQLGLLTSKCTSSWTSVNGVYGRKVTGSNGASIFLPAAGYHWYDYTNYVGSNGYYWSSTQRSYGSGYAYYLGFLSGDLDRYYDDRSKGQSVRPVTE